MTEDTKEGESPESVSTSSMLTFPVEISLTVKLPHEPGRLEFPVDPADSVADVVNTLKSIPVTQQHTNFALVQGDEILDETTTLGSLGTKVVLSLKPLAYTEQTVREHVSKVREIASLQLPVYFDAMHDASGVDAGASKLFNFEFFDKEEPEKTEEKAEQPEAEAKAEESQKVVLSEEEKANLAASTKAVTEKLNLDDFTGAVPAKAAPALKSLAVSAWSPVTVSNKARGDLLYLSAQTLEGETFHITAHVSGFFVNNSSNTRFDRAAKQFNGKTKRNHSLLTLLESLSPLFSQTRMKNGSGYASVPVESFALPSNAFLANPWLVSKPSKPHADLGRSQSNFLAGGLEGSDLQREWNEEYQAIRELPKDTLQNRVIREKLLAKTGFEFAQSAVRGAVAAVRGEIEPLNPSADPADYIYLRNGIFYSLCIDAGQYTEAGGELAARAAANKDLETLRHLNRLDLPDVYHLLTVIVDFCGRRVCCQTPVPGIFAEHSTDDSKPFVVYGYDQNRDVIRANEDFSEKLKPIAEAFHLKRHTAWANDGSSAEVVTSAETKGTKGSDGRPYVIELYRTTPLDIEFIDKFYKAGEEDSFPHREVTIRHEAVEEWWRRQLSYAVNEETKALEGKKDTEDSSEKPQIVVDPSKFSLNPDAFSLNAPAEKPEELKSDEEKVRELSKFVSEVLVKEFINEMEKEDSVRPVDGAHLTNMLHRSGINVRYLGLIADKAVERLEKIKEDSDESKKAIAEHNVKVDARLKEEAKKAKEAAEKAAREAENPTEKPEEAEEKTEDKANSEDKSESSDSEEVSKADYTGKPAYLWALRMVAIQEMISRAAKFILRETTVKLPFALAPYVVTHFANCLLGLEAKVEISEDLKWAYPEADLSFTAWTSESVAAAVEKVVLQKYRFALPAEWTSLNVRRVPLLREVSKKFGIQWLASAFSEPHFKVDDVIAINPVVKDSVFRSTTVEEVWEAGRVSLANGKREEGLALLNEAVVIYEQVYGTIHPDVAKAYGLLAATYSDIGLVSDAVTFCRRSLRITERCSGIDSYEMILCLLNAAYYEHGCKFFNNAFNMHRAAVDYWCIAFGEDHPSVINTLVSMGTILQQAELHKESLALFTQALNLSNYVHGPDSTVTALIRFQKAQILTLNNNFPEAIKETKKSYLTYRDVVGEDDVASKQAKTWHSQLGQYAKMVKQQEKRLKELKAQEAKKARQEAQQQKQKQSAVSSNPKIANQSIEEIMAFIEGPSKSSKKKKRSKK